MNKTVSSIKAAILKALEESDEEDIEELAEEAHEAMDALLHENRKKGIHIRADLIVLDDSTLELRVRPPEGGTFNVEIPLRRS